MIGSVLAAACDEGDPGFCPPSTGAFDYKELFGFDLLGVHFGFTKISLLILFTVLVLCAFFLAAVRRSQLVPGRTQWMGETAYSFIRNGVARDTIGPDGLRFAPYLASLFFFILVNNVYGVLPLAQIPATSRISVPAVLAILSFLLFNWVGVRKHGFGPYFKGILFPPGVPKPMYLILTPIEFASTLLVRPFTLAVRLFANMFAGHILLLVFITGTAYLLTVGNFSTIFSPVAFLMSIVLTFFELFVEMLQAYVFTVLTASYVSGALAEEH